MLRRKWLLMLLMAFATCSAAYGQEGYGGPPQQYAQQQYQPQEAGYRPGPADGGLADYDRSHGNGCCGQRRPQPTVCCRKWWDPYAYTQRYWDPCSCSWIICWYGAWKMDCHRPCNHGYEGGGYDQQQVAYQQGQY